MPLAILEAKAEGERRRRRDAAGRPVRAATRASGSRSPQRPQYILTDNKSGEYERSPTPPAPGDILHRLGSNIVWRGVAAGLRGALARGPGHPEEGPPLPGDGDLRDALPLLAGREARPAPDGDRHGQDLHRLPARWKLLQATSSRTTAVLFLTDRNSLKDQAYRAFSAFDSRERVVVDKDTVARGEHLVGKIFFANYQNLDEELDGKKLYEHFAPDFFDLVVVDECHRSGFGDWFGVLQHFGSAYQLGLTATPRELDSVAATCSPTRRRAATRTCTSRPPDGEPAYTYSLKQAIEDGYLVPYLLEERVTNVDEDGYTGPDGRHYTTANFERDIRLPDRTRAIAEDLWRMLGKYELATRRRIIFCVDDTHAAFMAQELRRAQRRPRLRRAHHPSERNSHQLERNFAEVGRAKPRVAVTVDLLTTGFDAPDVKNIVFARPLQSAILYKQMKGRGTRLCEDIDKRYFTIFDYSALLSLEDTEFDGHPANTRSPSVLQAEEEGTGEPAEKPVGEGITVVIVARASATSASPTAGRSRFEEYREQSKEVIRGIAPASLSDLLKLWIDKTTRRELRAELKDRDVHVAAFRHFLELDETDDVDILAKSRLRPGARSNPPRPRRALLGPGRRVAAGALGEQARGRRQALEVAVLADEPGPLRPLRHRRPRAGADVQRPAVRRASSAASARCSALRRPGGAQGRPRGGEATPLRPDGRIERT